MISEAVWKNLAMIEARIIDSEAIMGKEVYESIRFQLT